MKFCQPHWDRLRAAIETRGLMPLVARDGREAIARLKDEIEGSADKATFDPLMAAHNMILARCTELLGLYLYSGDYCPVCEICKPGTYPEPAPESRWKSNEDYFIDGPADAVLASVEGDPELSALLAAVGGKDG